MNLQITGLKVDAGGEGSRGGKIIGHTSGGKPIYVNAKHPDHKSFTSDDHFEAALLHKVAKRKGKHEGVNHDRMRRQHRNELFRKQGEEGVGSGGGASAAKKAESWKRRGAALDKSHPYSLSSTEWKYHEANPDRQKDTRKKRGPMNPPGHGLHKYAH